MVPKLLLTRSKLPPVARRHVALQPTPPVAIGRQIDCPPYETRKIARQSSGQRLALALRIDRAYCAVTAALISYIGRLGIIKCVGVGFGIVQDSSSDAAEPRRHHHLRVDNPVPIAFQFFLEARDFYESQPRPVNYAELLPHFLPQVDGEVIPDRKSTRLNSSHLVIS